MKYTPIERRLYKIKILRLLPKLKGGHTSTVSIIASRIDLGDGTTRKLLDELVESGHVQRSTEWRRARTLTSKTTVKTTLYTRTPKGAELYQQLKNELSE